MRIVLLGLLCVVALGSMAAAAEGGAPGEAAMDGGGMPQAPAGNGTHPICWFEIQAKDMEAARKFYGGVFGWEITEFGRPDYVMFTPPGGPMGALTAQPHDLERTQGTMATICTQTLDADIAALEALGIEFAEPKTAIGEGEHVAHTAVIRDSAGTLYGLVDMAPELPVPHVPSGLGSGPKPPPNSLSSIELYGGDFAKVKQLFGDLFGWGLLDTMPQYMMFDAGGGMVGVFQSHTAVAHSMPYIYVEDVSAKLAEIVAAGGKQIGEPASMPGMGTFGYFSDPNGVGLGLIGP
jgi:predicted enzyme related to lactoylglutathione lyase